METRLELVETKAALKPVRDDEKRVPSGKQFGVDSVQFPDWRVTNGQSRTTQLIVSYKEGKKISKLREPRNLYALANKHHYSNINIPRWPVEMKVLSESPCHVDYHPSDPEVFYDTDSVDSEDIPVLTKAESGQLVYENCIGHSKYFDRSRAGGNPVKAMVDNLHIADPDALHFESRFESGNLFKAVKVGPRDYQLWLRTDLYTLKYTQWYYFRVENTQVDQGYRFTIMNFMKSSSLYSEGMKPLMYSEKEARQQGIGWRRVGTNIRYYKNKLKRQDGKGERHLYSLSWTVTFPYAGDRCYFAHCYPYTYTDLQEYLRKLSKDPGRSRCCKQRLLTRTLAGNSVYIITITSPSKCPTDAKNKRGVIFTARVHPGETNSSWIMKGLLDYLTSDKPDAKLLRDTFVFKIVPMLNPDGVIVGNYRCSLSGRDLNRNYKTALKESFPSVWHTKEMVKSLSEEREITLYCDLHGHSRQQNVFIYGCEDRLDLANGFKERVFPMMLSKNCRDKIGTGRVVMWNLGIKNSYTLEATFCGSTLGSKSGHHFTTVDYESMGYHLCDTLLDYCDPDVSKYLLVLNELDGYVKAMILERMKMKGVAQPEMDISDINLDRDYLSESSTSGSDSSVSDGLPMHVLYSRPQHISKKTKKKLKTRKERNRRRAKTLAKSVKENEDKQHFEAVESDMASRLNPNGQTPNDFSLEQRKSSRSSSHQKTSRGPQRENLERKNTPSKKTSTNDIKDAKIHHYLDSLNNAYGQNRLPISSNGLGIPQLRYTGNGPCFGLAPATPHGRSSNRCAVRRRSTASGEATTEEEEGNFIGRYMARQIHISKATRESDRESKPDKSEVLRKLQLCKDSYQVLAGVQTQDSDRRSQDVGNRKDKSHKTGHEGPMAKYCTHHAAMLRKTEENEREHGDKVTLACLPAKRKSPSTSVEQSSPSHDRPCIAKDGQLPRCSTTIMSGVKLDEDRQDEADERDTSRAAERSKSDGNFRIPPLCEDYGVQKRRFNFRGVSDHPCRANYATPTRRHGNENRISTRKNSHSAFLGDRLGQEPTMAGKAEKKDPVPLKLSSSSTESSALLTTEQGNQEKSPSVRCSSEVRTCETPVFVPLDFTPAPKDSSTVEEPSLKTVSHLRQKLQNLNTSGRLVTFALNNQLNDVEKDIHNSLLNDYMKCRERHNHKMSKAKKRTESKVNRQQGKLHFVSPSLWKGPKNIAEEKREATKNEEVKNTSRKKDSNENLNNGNSVKVSSIYPTF